MHSQSYCRYWLREGGLVENRLSTILLPGTIYYSLNIGGGYVSGVHTKSYAHGHLNATIRMATMASFLKIAVLWKIIIKNVNDSSYSLGRIVILRPIDTSSKSCSCMYKLRYTLVQKPGLMQCVYMTLNV